MEEIRNLAIAFSKRVLLPRWDELDAAAPALLDEILQAAAAAGLFGFAIPEAAGGSGLGVAEYAVFLEEVSRACAGIGALLAAHFAGIAPLLLAAEGNKTNRLLSAVTRAEADGKPAVFAAAIRERQSPEFIQEDLETGADPNGETCVVAGVKTRVPGGAAAAFFTVLAKNPKDGSRCWVVVPLEARGVEVRPEAPRLGLRICPTNDVVFHGVEVPSENVISVFSQRERLLDYHRLVDPALASVPIGMSAEAHEAAMNYAAKRYQGGKMICDHDAVRMILADMEMLVHASRALTRDGKAGLLASAFAAEAAEEVCLHAVQVLGGYGYMKDYRIERILRDAKTYRALVGPRARRMESVRTTLETLR
jgi:alkylation response protein AidB-like acyl-CoA dehydrogenase